MRNNKKNNFALNTKILFVFCAISFSQAFAQHYSLYSNYINNGLVINPAFAGRNEGLDATMLHRRQWTGMNGAPVTTSFSVSSPLKLKSMNLGISIVDERIGGTMNQNVNGIYAYRFKSGSMNCSFGLQAGFLVGRTDWSKLRRNDSGDELLEGQSKTMTAFTSGAGYYMYNQLFFLGVSLPYLVNTNSLKSVANGPIVFNAGYLFELKDSSAIKPSLLIRLTPGSPISYDLNISYAYKQKYALGLSYRRQESVVAILEIPIQKQIKIFYSYDFGMGPVKKYHNGSHEIMLRYLLFKSPEEKKPEEVKPDESKPIEGGGGQ